jgi:type VI secretion system Hcp family effector
MKNNLFYRITLFILLFQLPVLFAFGQDATLTIKSGSTSISIKCSGYTYSMKSSQSSSSGAGAGKAGAGDVIIQKAADNNTLTLQQMLITGENLTTVTLELFKQAADGRLSVSQTITMSNANISQITHYQGTSAPAKITGAVPIEELTFVAQKIDFGTSGATTTTTVPAKAKMQTGYDVKENKKQ